MARIAHCLDVEPNPDGTCTHVEWIEQPSLADTLPTPEQATAVGVPFALGLILIAFVASILKPETEE